LARASDPPFAEQLDAELDAAFSCVIDEPASTLDERARVIDEPACAIDQAAEPVPGDAPNDGDREPVADDGPVRRIDGEPVDDKPERPIARNVHERLRGLNLNDQIKMAQTGETHERVVLERIYGKTVWEALLRNPRLTGPEVARIARMGALPKVLLQVILDNGAWLRIPEVRRALLASKRLGNDQIEKVLRFLPKHELKLATMQTAYPPAVRDAARRLLRGEDH
jgi:hypothetical protein